jgi:hypothetical protein
MPTEIAPRLARLVTLLRLEAWGRTIVWRYHLARWLQIAYVRLVITGVEMSEQHPPGRTSIRVSLYMLRAATWLLQMHQRIKPKPGETMAWNKRVHPEDDE